MLIDENNILENYEIDFPGWKNIIKSTIDALNQCEEKIIAVQIKEKFGGLRFYCRFDEIDENSASKMHEILSSAEEQSTKICFFCGSSPVRSNGRRWSLFCCVEHESKNEFPSI